MERKYTFIYSFRLVLLTELLLSFIHSFVLYSCLPLPLNSIRVMVFEMHFSADAELVVKFQSAKQTNLW